MADFRALVRLSAMAVWTLLLATAVGLGVVLTAPAPRARRAWRRAMVRHWARGTARILRIVMTSNGAPPSRPFLLVANHLSYVDIVVLAATTGCVFVAKREVAEWPVWGPLARLAGTMFVDRGRARDTVRVLAAMREALGRGEGVVVFPEGTSTAGASIAPLRPALLEAAAASELPVHYVTLSYRTLPGAPTASESVCWWGDMTFGPHLFGLARLRRVTATLTWGATPLHATDRRQLAERLHASLTAQFTPVQQEIAWTPPS